MANRYYLRSPYFYRRFRSWRAMEDVDQGLADAGNCLDAPDLLPTGGSDSKEDLPSPTFIHREEPNG